jgi:hypothetical protein
MNADTLRGWLKQADIDSGTRQGVTTSEAARIAELEREVRELKRANQILKSASAFFRNAFSSANLRFSASNLATRAASTGVGAVAGSGCARRYAFTHPSRVDSLISSSRATCATVRPLCSTSCTASALNSSVNLRLRGLSVVMSYLQLPGNDCLLTLSHPTRSICGRSSTVSTQRCSPRAPRSR